MTAPAAQPHTAETTPAPQPRYSSAAMGRACSWAYRIKDKTQQQYARAFIRWMVGTQPECPATPSLRLDDFQKYRRIRNKITRLLEGKK